MMLLHLDLETHASSEQIRGVLAGNAGSCERRLGVAAVVSDPLGHHGAALW